MTQLFTAQATSQASEPFLHLGREAALNVYLAGDLAEGRVIVEAQTPDGAGWVRLAGGVLTMPGMHVIVAAPFVGRLRLEGTDAAALDAWVEVDKASTRRRVEQAAS